MPSFILQNFHLSSVKEIRFLDEKFFRNLIRKYSKHTISMDGDGIFEKSKVELITFNNRVIIRHIML